MEEITRDLLVSFILFAGIFGIGYVFVMTRHKERMSMLEKGVDASIFVSKRGSQTLKFGMLSVGIALGILMGYLLKVRFEMEEEAAFLSMVFLFGGISLIINHLLDKSHKN
jgi:hypothetical protein